MAWNEPGKPDGKDPWGSGRRDSSGGSDLDQLVRKLRDRLSGLFGGKGGGGFSAGQAGGAALIVVAIVVVWLLSGVYIVQEGEKGVVLRFGEKNEITDRGLRWRLPWPLERVEKVNVAKISTIEVGYRTVGNSRNKVPNESLMLTEDENIIDIEFAVQFRVRDPEMFLFSVHRPEDTIPQATESAVREVVGRSKLDFVFENRKGIEADVRKLLQTILDNYRIGIEIQAVEMQRAQPPKEVKDAFDDAVRAREDKERVKNEAEAYAYDIIPRARGDAESLVKDAEGYQAAAVARAQGDAQRFVRVANEYVKAPAVTRQRLYLETMEKVLSRSTKVLIDQRGGNSLIYLPLDKLTGAREVKAPLPAPTAPAAPAAAPEPAMPERDPDSLRTRPRRGNLP
jgi:membrane protease subunit HflK